MANYYASCRTNYFRVKDEDAFEDAMAKIPSIRMIKEEKVFFILGDCPERSGWPSCVYDEKKNKDVEIDLPALVSSHLADDEVAIFMEVGAEKLVDLRGYAEAINNKGERCTVNLDSIYKLASKLGSNITCI
ncbi:MAG: hypothetical protein V3T17_01025 [Pseudomonadales bacterium]